MPFAGESFEEFVGEYFRYVKGYVVETHVDYLRKKEWYDSLNIKQKKKQDRWSDMDVLAIDKKSERAIIVSCSEGAKKVEDLDKELKFAEKFVKEKYGFQKVDKFAAFVFFYDFIGKIDAYIKELNSRGIKIIWFYDMVREIVEEIRKKNNHYQGKTYVFKVGKFNEPAIWLLQQLDLVAANQGKHILPEPVNLSNDDYIKKHGVVKV